MIKKNNNFKLDALINNNNYKQVLEHFCPTKYDYLVRPKTPNTYQLLQLRQDTLMPQQHFV